MKLDCAPAHENAVPWNLTRLALMALAVSGLGAAPNSNLGRNGAVPADGLPGAILPAEPTGVLPQGLTILYPENDTLFPPEIAPPTIRWQDDNPAADTWLVRVMFSRDPGRMTFIASQPEWTPAAADWEIIKQRSLEKPARITIRGTTRAAPRRILSGSQVDIRTSKDEVGAPIFYREVKLPLAEAGGDPLHLRWRLGSVSSPGPPPVVLDKLPVCGNCHSFSLDGKTLAMDVDYEGKGSYVIRGVAPEMAFTTNDIINWDDYRREEGEKTFGLLSQLSPDGNHVASTVKDRSVFAATGSLAFSQLFFPIKGIIAIYDRQNKTFAALPGADDPQYVQSNPAWSPEGANMVFARARAFPLDTLDPRDLNWALTRKFLRESVPFKFDLYRVPFNHGRGGTPEPLAGAAQNGKSNYFPKYSPDGKWIVFCQAENYMMLQPDSALYIVPANGGEARRLRGNTAGMNSWHSWSPNSRWLVFASKAFSPYTQLFLTHIDDLGNSSPPVLLSQFSSPDRAANIPEFVNAPPGALVKIEAQIALDLVCVREGNELIKTGDYDGAIGKYRAALAHNPKNVAARQRLGVLLFYTKGQSAEGMRHLAAAFALAPANLYCQYDWGMALLHQGQVAEAVPCLAEALRLMSDHTNATSEYNPFDTLHKLGLMLLPRHRRNRLMNPEPELEYALGLALFLKGDYEPSVAHLRRAATGSQSARFPEFPYQLALVLALQGKVDEAVPFYLAGRQQKPELDTALVLADLIGAGCANEELFQQRIGLARKELQTGIQAGRSAASSRAQK